MADENNEEEEKKGGSKKNLIMMIAVVVVTLALGAGGAIFFMGGSDSAEVEMVDGEMIEEEIMPEMSIYHELHPAFVANFSGKSKKKYMQVYIVALAHEDSVIDDLQLHMPAVRNDVLMTLSKTTSDEIETVEGKEELRQKVLSRIKETMKKKTGKEGIEDIYFTKFVAQ
ncbi:MAG: flagellar basal body-associated FliL family protein [Gammaproteobacteria bacterium]|nr:flagellar basal body-associated FliL family protein [Gammaproteobacteria bacterium]